MCYTEGQEFWWKNLIKMLCCIYVTHALSNLEAFLQQQRRGCIYVINNFFLQQGTNNTWYVTILISQSALIEVVWDIPYCSFDERIMNRIGLVPFPRSILGLPALPCLSLSGTPTQTVPHITDTDRAELADSQKTQYRYLSWRLDPLTAWIKKKKKRLRNSLQQ